MTPDEIINLLKPRVRAALEIVGDLIIAEAINWIPIDSGDLRRSSTGKEFESDFRMILKSGEGLPYATAQYFGFSGKRGPKHLLEGGKPIKIIDSPGVKFSKTGGKRKNRYATAYRQKKDELQNLSGFSNQPRWFERVLADSSFKSKLRNVFIKALRSL